MTGILVNEDLFVMIRIVKLSEEQAIIGFVVRSCNIDMVVFVKTMINDGC